MFDPRTPSTVLQQSPATVLLHDRRRGLDWIVMLFLPNLVIHLFFTFAMTYVIVAGVHRYLDNFARRHGDPDWRKKLVQQCAHCGLNAWTPCRPTWTRQFREPSEKVRAMAGFEHG
jgi:hypothetical protein